MGQNSDEELANYYFNNGECDKALGYFDKVYEVNPTHLNFMRYLDCTRKERTKNDIIKLIKSQIKKDPGNIEYEVMLGQEYERQGDAKNADKTYRAIIDNMQPNSRSIVAIQRAFSKIGKYELALEVLQKGDKLLKGNYPLNIQFAEVYGDLGRTEEMIDQYLDLLIYSPSMISSLKRIMPRMIDFEKAESEAYNMLNKSLIKRIQKSPNELIYYEFLIWTLIQRNNFSAALIQAKALDKRMGDEGKEVYLLGKQSSFNKDYKTARKAFKYVVELGEGLPYYYSSQQLLLNTRFLEVTTKRDYTQEELEETIVEYKEALGRIGKKGSALSILHELAYIMAFYADKAPEAKVLLEEALNYPGGTDIRKAELKTLLADVLVILDDIWEASLLYMQVEKAFKFEPIGFEAKYKNARVFYYAGDFKWAQSQLDVLKGSTTKLIANDAMKLSIFITDNLGLDSNFLAMEKFARADLLMAQRKFEAAGHVLDSIEKSFPFHSLMDEILMRRAQAEEQQGHWKEALAFYEQVVEKYGFDIHGDEALLAIANIYEDYFNEKEKAADYYLRLMKEHRGSLFVTEARKRFRAIKDGTDQM
jgi:tetratricopeptide (TPR) repeat protein